MNKTTFIGIDPGASGAIAVLTDADIDTFNLSHTEADIATFLEKIIESDNELIFACDPNMLSKSSNSIFCLIEKVWSFPGQGVSSSFTFGQNYGFLRGLLIAMKIPFDEVLPRKWQSEFVVPCEKVPKLHRDASKEEKKKSNSLKSKYKKEHKNNLKSKAQQLYPNIKVTLANSDAILICKYCELINK